MHFSIDRTVHTTAFDKPVVDHWLERKITQTAAGSTEKDRSDDRPLQRRARYRLSYIPLLFNNALNTFYLRLYGVEHMVKDHSDSERQNPLLPHGLLFPVLLYAPSHRQDSTYHSLCYTSHGALAGTRNSLIIINE